MELERAALYDRILGWGVSTFVQRLTSIVSYPIVFAKKVLEMGVRHDRV